MRLDRTGAPRRRASRREVLHGLPRPRGRACLVVGGGRVATEKVHGLLDCGARVTVVAPQVDDELRRLPVGSFAARSSRPTPRTASSSSPRRATARSTPRSPRASGLCNVVDVPELCNFILPAIVRRDPIAVAVSTGRRLAGARAADPGRHRRPVGPEHAELARLLRRCGRGRSETADLRGAPRLLPGVVEEALWRDGLRSSAPARAIPG